MSFRQAELDTSMSVASGPREQKTNFRSVINGGEGLGTITPVIYAAESGVRDNFSVSIPLFFLKVVSRVARFIRGVKRSVRGA